MRKVVSALFLAAAVGSLAVYSTGGVDSLLNFTAGFFSAAVVLAASSFGYWQMVSGAETSTPHHDLPDLVEGIDDRYGLWEEEDKTENPKEIGEIMAEEKRRLKKSRRGFKGFLKTAKPAISLYRLGAYLLLVAGVYALIRGDMFDPLLYLAGAGLAPLVVAGTLYFGER
ncbi:hypothetical protein [Hydrogenimonas sp.]